MPSTSVLYNNDQGSKEGELAKSLVKEGKLVPS